MGLFYQFILILCILSLIASVVAANYYGVRVLIKLIRQFIHLKWMKRLLDAVWFEREQEIVYWLDKLHARNLVFSHGENILYYAVKAHRLQAVAYLLQQAVPIEYEINQRVRVSVLSMAIVEHEPIEYIQLLIDGGANLAYVDSFDKTPEEYANEYRRIDVLDLFATYQKN